MKSLELQRKIQHSIKIIIIAIAFNSAGFCDINDGVIVMVWVSYCLCFPYECQAKRVENICNKYILEGKAEVWQLGLLSAVHFDICCPVDPKSAILQVLFYFKHVPGSTVGTSYKTIKVNIHL